MFGANTGVVTAAEERNDEESQFFEPDDDGRVGSNV